MTKEDQRALPLWTLEQRRKLRKRVTLMEEREAHRRRDSRLIQLEVSQRAEMQIELMSIE